MDKIKYRETITKLLALSQSPNEHEAKLALLKAQELMAKHKISELELRNVKSRLDEKVVTLETTITYSGKRNPWIEKMAVLICENHGCEYYFSYISGQVTQTVCIMGLESDAQTCLSALEYAVDFVKGKYDLFKKRHKGQGVYTIRSEYNSYAYGFVEGLRKAYRDQIRNMKFEIVLKVPEEVRYEYNQIVFSPGPVYYDAYTQNRGSRSWMDGMRDGEDFGSVKNIEG